jgi:hypothetical protein
MHRTNPQRLRKWQRTLCSLGATVCLVALAAAASAGVGPSGPQLEWATQLSELNLMTPAPVPIPLASDPGNTLPGNPPSQSGYGFVDSQVTVTLSSQRLINPGPPSLGAACATVGGDPAGQMCVPDGDPEPIDPNVLDGEQMFVSSFFDVFFDITVTDVDTRAGRDYAGQPDGASFTLQNLSDMGNRDMSTNYQVIFDKDAPNFGLLPPPETFPYIGHFNIEIPLGADINGNGENDKIKFTLAAHQVNGENRTFIILPDGTVVDDFDSEADLSGAVVDMSTDPPFTIEMEGPSEARSLLLNPVVPEPSAMVLLAGGIVAQLFRRRRRVN